MADKAKKAFENSFNPKCIYVFRINDAAHQNLLKIGDATVKSDKPLEELTPNCKELNQAAKLRIKDYTNTAGISFELLHTELAVMEVKDEEGTPILLSFKDHRVHSVLTNSNIERVEFPNSTAREWFKVDLETAKKAITAVKEGKKNLSGEQITQNFSEILFRPEQSEAIRMTLDKFKTQNRMLWNAKMRFGKTLTALEVARRSKFAKTIIITHRPVVDAGWYDDFNKIFYEEKGTYIYGSKGSGTTLQDLLASGKKFVYFASMQDLRGSKRVGGNFNKNEDVFDLDWDFVIVDEAHEGTTTMLGDSVIKAVVKEDNNYTTKFLALSGTPFNILNDFDKNIYTWDYIMEQKAKAEWTESHLEPNPYDDLPEMHIFTYDIGKLLFDGRYVELVDKAFNFREFFRVWTGDIKKDRMALPEGVSVGDFYHEEDVMSFLNLICAASEESQYPYANEEYRNIFKHTLWMVPGVKEARALSKMLKEHPVFSFFEVVNVAGDGDEEEAHDEALKKVRKAIKKAGNDGYTITLSCGKLTTGVTVPEWTAAFYLAGSFATSASSYLQTIFRVQSPCNKYGMMKNTCYVFDFAPDRTLKMVAEAAAISTKAGGTSSDDRAIMGEFLNYCPVISIDGTRMKPYDTGSLLQQLKRAYAERAVRTGFDDINIYSNELLKLTEDDLSLLNDIKGIIGTSKAAHQTNEININDQGFTEEEYRAAEEAKKKPKKERTPEEEKLLKELAEKRKQRKDAISVLRGISIRMPLLIYGADIPFADDVTIEELPDLVDDASWKEFMPDGITKDKFKELIKFYDPDIFVSAGRRIRNIAKSADELPPIERAVKIAELFACFKNPDKETVLTPWRVVNMHIGDCLGGWNFFNEDFTELLEEPRFIDHGVVTKRTLANPDAHIMEINSKTGLYPLYVVASIFLTKLNELDEEERTIERQEEIWKETIENNLFIICKTPMAKTITKRTIAGYKSIRINAHAFDDLSNQFKEKRDQLIKKVLKPSFWGKKGKNMHINAVVGNPPYQQNITSAQGNQALSKQLFPSFIETSVMIGADYVSLITPSRWFTADAQDGSFVKLREFIKENNHISKMIVYENEKDLFSNVEIKGGLNYFLYDKGYEGNVEFTIIGEDGTTTESRPLFEDGVDVIISSGKAISILSKVKNKDFIPLTTITTGRNAFGIIGKPDVLEKVSVATQFEGAAELRCKAGEIRWIKPESVTKGQDIFKSYKVLISKSAGNPNSDKKVIGSPYPVGPNVACTDSLFPIGCFDNQEEAENLAKYLKTQFLRYMVSILKMSQNVTQLVYGFVPLQDFTDKSDIDWSLSVEAIDEQLFSKYGLTKKEKETIKETVRACE